LIPLADRGRPFAALLLGAFATLGFAPVDHAEATLAALVGLFFLADGAAPRRAALIGWSYGLGFFMVGISWVYVSMHDVGGMPAPLAALAVLLFAAYLAAFPALAVALGAHLKNAHWTHRLLVLPACWGLSEWLRGWLFSGFPWLAAGYAGTGGPFAGYAPVVGVHGVGWLYAFAAMAVVDLMRRFANIGWHGLAPRDAALPLVLAVGAGLSQAQWTMPQGAPVKVALLQGNIPQDLKFEAGRFESTLALYQRLITTHPASLVVLPETALPRMLQTIPREYLESLQNAARAAGTNLVTGVPLAESRERYFNSAISLGADPSQRYDKAHLVPFGEFIPWGFRWFVDAMKMPLGDFTRGTDTPQPLQLGAQRVAINICYEDLFGEEIIRQLPQANILVNISNIAWFGDSLAPHQHLQISRMRALETGRAMLRATNTGMTAAIDAHGRVTQRLQPFTEGALVTEVQGYAGATPYVRLGNWPVICACVLTLTLALARRRRAARDPAPA
jgi:apolipoprotein N-acyltransferase